MLSKERPISDVKRDLLSVIKVSRLVIFDLGFRLALFGMMLSMSISLNLFMGCDDGVTPKDCTSDTDCREGYTCDLVMFVGECVQRQSVQACGDLYCLVPQERCETDRCVPSTDGEGGMSGAGVEGDESGDFVGDTAGDEAGDTTGDRAGDAAVDEAGDIPDDEAGDAAGEVAGGSGGHSGDSGGFTSGTIADEEQAMAWAFEIEDWSDPLILLAPANLSLSGRLRTDHGGTPIDAHVRLQISPISVFTQLPPELSDGLIEIPLDPNGAFTLNLALSIGTYALELSAYTSASSEDDFTEDTRTTLTRQVVVDEFVTTRGSDLFFNQAPLRYMGVSLPDLIPWLATLPERARPAAARQVWRALAVAGARVARVYVGWSDPSFRIHDAQGRLDLERVTLLEVALMEARLEGIKIIGVLADGAQELDTLNAYLHANGVLEPTPRDELSVYQNTPARAALYQWFTMLPQYESVLTGMRFQDDPGILGWEIVHCPSWSVEATEADPVSSTLSRIELLDFIEGAVEQLTQAAPQHLIFTGEVGLDVNPTPYQPWAQELSNMGLPGLLSGVWGGRWSELRSLLNEPMRSQLISGFTLDYDALHLTSSVSWPQIGQLWMRAHTAAHIGINRPLVIHLARVRRDLLSPQQQVQVLRQWAREAVSQGVNGFMFGELRLASAQSPLQPYDWSFEDPASHTLISEIAAIFNSSGF